MKALWVFLISTLLSAAVFTVVPAHAQTSQPAALQDARDPNEISIYYSEPIGAGERVYQIAACKKQVSFAPLLCTEELLASAGGFKYFQQCRVDGKVLKGQPIKGCIRLGGALIGGLYPQVDVVKYDAKECLKNPENQSFVYVPEFGIVKSNPTDPPALLMDPNSYSAGNVVATVAWPSLPYSGSAVSPVDGLDKVAESIVDDAKAFPLYRTGVCARWDWTADGEDFSAGSASSSGRITATQKKLITTFADSGIPKALVDAGCNNDNNSSLEDRPDLHSSPFNSTDSVTCSTLYRLTGRSGSDLFGRYVSALYRWAASVVGIISVLVIVVSGIQISMAGGDTGKVDEAKTRIMQSLIGIIILFLSGIILYVINPTFYTG
ncbi:hypothetical protein CO046_04490 [Candidatus Peregrinibacteria bacterium CG_4_9_14_0_2_um_filter_53_11]|nr:MAG: hypothetical protein CO046_04490 [Candidatus Peregrinibacteria bacterium CG_4_9_14_0_2_um_filter_53_11]